MRSLLRVVHLFVLCCGCAATPIESVFVPAPDSGLEVGFAAQDPGNGTIVEYVPAGETIQAWKHIVSIQFMENERRPKEVVLGELESLARGHGGTVQWSVIERDANSILYEWSIVDCPEKGDAYQDQCELARLLRGNDGFHRIAYTERARTMDPAMRERYLAAFRAAYVVNGKEMKPIVLQP